VQKTRLILAAWASIWKLLHVGSRAALRSGRFAAISTLSCGRDQAAIGGQEQAMKAQVTVTLKSGVLDPQGKAIEGALKSLGVPGIASVRQGKVFDIEIDGDIDGDRIAAEARLREAAERLLANTVIENYDVKLIG
jgi:phosphoribosylformylglycinamidine synthase